MAKAPRRKHGKVVTTPTAESNVLAGNQSATVRDRDIARRAYELYERRGGEHGRDLDDWIQAERELTRSHIRLFSGGNPPSRKGLANNDAAGVLQAGLVVAGDNRPWRPFL
jgi:hypothetical protein